jgi:hypothetical protein
MFERLGHVLVRRRKGALALFIIGILVAGTVGSLIFTRLDSGGYSTATITWDSAQSAIIANLWHGRIYSFKAYNRPLTDTELLNNYNIGKVKHGL